LSLATAFTHKHRLRNALGSYLDYRLSLLSKRPVLHHFPPALMIEPTNICNLHCPLCPSGNGTLQRPKGMMPLAVFEKIIGQIQAKIGMLILWNQGEPFLNPDFYAMIELAAKQKFYTMTSTNASLPLDLERIVRSGLGKIIISMDGISAATYNSYRVNGNFELVLANLQELVKLKRRMRSKTPVIDWQFIVLSHNEHEIDDVKHLAKSIGVDKLEFKTAQIYTQADMQFLPRNHKFSRYQTSQQGFQLKTELLNRCRRLWTQPVINWDGEMSICCYDKDLSLPIGNIADYSFSDLWFSLKMMSLRAHILTNRAQYDICRNCGEGIIQKLKL